jgi:hypothetical protein
MRLDETLTRNSLPPVRATFLPLDGAGSGTARPLRAGQARRGRREALAAFYRGLMKTWIRLYARPPRCLRTFL